VCVCATKMTAFFALGTAHKKIRSFLFTSVFALIGRNRWQIVIFAIFDIFYSIVVEI
jgi:hypothetical protein